MLAANTDSSVEMEREKIKIKIKKGCHAKIAPFFGRKEDELMLGYREVRECPRIGQS